MPLSKWTKNIAPIDVNGQKGMMAMDREGNPVSILGSEDWLVTQNFLQKFRDGFRDYNTTDNWTEVSKWTNDIIQTDWNAGWSSYLVISKSSLYQDTETIIETKKEFDMPIELSIGLSISQRTLAQDTHIEFVDTDTPEAEIQDITISAIQQATTILTVTTSTPHGLVPWKRIGIEGCPDSRLNYPSVVVATIPTPSQFTVVAWPAGNITSITAWPYNTVGMKVYFRPTMNYATNGISLAFENATATNGSIFIKSEGGDSFPSGTIAGNHTITTGSTAPVQLLNLQDTFAFTSTTEYRMAIQGDRVQVTDSALDSTAEASARITRTQTIPDPSKKYKFRIRVKNQDSLPIPVAQIVSINKTSNTVSRIVLDRDISSILVAGATGSYINLYGVRDQTASFFPNITTPVAITTIVNSNTIDVAHGTLGSGATSYGWFISIANGNQAIQGVLTQVIQSATLASGLLTLVGSATWAGASIGDYVNLVSVRNIVNGNALGIDGSWKIRNIATTTMILEPVGSTVAPADFVLTNAGGAVIKRTDVRIPFIRIFDYARQRVEVLQRPSGDAMGGVPVSIKSIPTVTSNVQGANAQGSTTLTNPIMYESRTTNRAVTPDASMTRPITDKYGRQIVALNVRDLVVQEAMVTITLTTETTISPAVASVFKDIHGLIITNTSATATRVDIRDTTAGTVRASFMAEAGKTSTYFLDQPLKQSAVNTNWTAQLGTAVTDVRITAIITQNI